MRCWLLLAVLFVAWPCAGQEPMPYAPLLGASDSAATLESILQRLDRLETENASLRRQLDGADPSESVGSGAGAPAMQAINLQPVDEQVEAGAEIELCVCRRPGCPHCQTHGGNGSDYPTLGWGGFLQLDTGWVSQDDANVAAVGDVQAQTGLRRVRLRAKGRVRADISYVVDLDFAASGHPSFRDVQFTLHDRPIVENLAVGYFQQPFGLDAMSSGRNLLLMERQLPFAFAPFRQTGVRSFGTALDDRVTWAHSGYAYPTDSFGVSEGDRGGWAYAARGTTLAIDDPASGALVHVGGSYSFQDPGNDIVRYSIQPGFFVTDPGDNGGAGNVPVFVDTGDILSQNVNLFSAELVALWGPVSFQSEAVRSLVNPDAGPQLGFGGASAKLGYVLTGEAHQYQRSRGVLGGVTPRDETTSFFDPLSGAWEAAAGWAWIDLDDQSIEGGEMQTIIVGLNRYMNSFTKLQLNVIRVLLDEPADGRSAATVVALRAQAEF
jgi:phosphate-selective porin OprO/OprP